MKRTRILAAATLALAAASLLFAGPLDPPAGPVAPTYKTLTEVEPRIAINATNTPGDADSLFKITLPGSYYLTANIAGVAGKHGIEIAASGVTLDLMGYDLLGVAGTLDGVSAAASGVTNITIRSGSIRGWGNEGVDLGTFSAINSAVVDVGTSGNSGMGLLIGSRSTITGCSAYNNTGSGIVTATGCTVSACTAYDNASNGITTNIGSTIIQCTASNNAANGISAGPSSTVTRCTAYANSGTGIATGAGCTITVCTAYENNLSGIVTGFGCTVSTCTSRANTLDGIAVPSDCLVLANTCSNNGSAAGDGAAIHANGNDNRIEGNNCTGTDRGIQVDLSGNIIIKNTCSGNTINWVIASNNYYGPIIDRTGDATAAVNGSAAASTLVTTDPNANFSY